MDPLSATANLLAVLVVAMQSCTYLVDMFCKVADAPAEVRHNTVWLRALYSTFSELHVLANDPRFLDVQVQLPLGFGSRLAECRADLLEMEARFRRVGTDLPAGRMHQTWARVKYLFTSEQWLAKLSVRLQMYQSTFTVDLMTIQIKLTVLYNSSRQAIPPALNDEITPPPTGDSTGTRCARDRLARFIASYAEPISVRADTWYSLCTHLGRFEFWSGPVRKQRWRDNKPEYFNDSGRGVAGFGCQLCVGWGERHWALSVFCTLDKCFHLRGLPSSPMRWNVSFPRILPAHSDIFESISAGSLAAVQLIFSSRKATPWDMTPDGWGLLHAAAESNSVEMVNLILDQGVDVNSKDEEGRTPLHVAIASSGNYEISRILLEHGADLGSHDADGRTPLHVFFSPVVGTILTNHRGAVTEQVGTRDISGMTILQYAVWSSASEPQQLDPYIQGDQAYPLVARDYTGRSLLHLAAQRGNVPLLKYFLRLPMFVGLDARDRHGQSVLHYAVHSRRTETIDLLLAHGADVYAVDAKGQTLLHCAVKRDNVAAVKRILGACNGSMLHSTDRDGITPSELAHRHRSFKAATYLDSLTPQGSDTEEAVRPLNTNTSGRRNTPSMYLHLQLLDSACFLISFWAILWCISCLCEDGWERGQRWRVV